jgi:UDP-N-acetylmuramate-alanine ligase
MGTCGLRQQQGFTVTGCDAAIVHTATQLDAIGTGALSGHRCWNAVDANLEQHRASRLRGRSSGRHSPLRNL